MIAVLVIPAVAAADGIHPYSPISPSLSVMVRDDHGGTESTAVGVTLELAVGSGRFQYFAEGSSATLQRTDRARELRGGLGVRWLARSFELGRHSAFELDVEGVTGITRLESGATRVYPDLGFGVGWAVRLVDPRLVFRISARAMFEQTQRDATSMASSTPGFVALFGFGY